RSPAGALTRSPLPACGGFHADCGGPPGRAYPWPRLPSTAVTSHERIAHPSGRKNRPINPLYPSEWARAWLRDNLHALLPVFMDPDSGLTWVLSIVGLTVVVRTLIIPLFVRQIRASRAMQMVSPEPQAVQKKYKGKTDQESRQKMAEETMAIYKEAGA